MIEDAFTTRIKRELARSGFVPPALNEACTLVFESPSLSACVRDAALLLDVAEADRAKRFRFDRDRMTYTLAHAVWRVVLSLCLNATPAEVPLMMARSGQPSLPGTRFSTSLSHTDRWVAVAICHGETVGVDIEQEPPRVVLADMVDTICAPGEKARLTRLTGAERDLALLVLWTRKEALLKAFGVGLGVDPSTVTAETNELVYPPRGVGDQPACRLVTLDLPPGLVGALAVPAGVLLKRQHQLKPD